jgi:predicted transcriptional regulator with HTH domain
MIQKNKKNKDMEIEKKLKLKELKKHLKDLKEQSEYLEESFINNKREIYNVQEQISEIEKSIDSPYISQFTALKGKCIKYNTYDSLYNLAVVDDVKIYDNSIILMISGYRVADGYYLLHINPSKSFDRNDKEHISEFLKDLVILSKSDFNDLLHETFQKEFDRLYKHID